ncbi:hypothetical protein GGP46_002615, partial [Salinibacter ruber]|nr:hypothetical protein [Salinibacter ruber]
MPFTLIGLGSTPFLEKRCFLEHLNFRANQWDSLCHA